MPREFVPYIRVSTLDDLIRSSYESLKAYGEKITPTKGEATEISGITFELENPRSRLSQSVSRGKVFSAIGEFCWYLSGDDSGRTMDYYIKGYSMHNADEPDSELCKINGAYGPRLFGENSKQFENIYNILSVKPYSRQAVVRLFDAKDVFERHVDVPCTCTLQFLLREGRLNLIVYMRSNDVYKGLPHDIFCFTMFQEIMAKRLNVELGYYKHIVGSLHLYATDENQIEPYLQEGYYSTNMIMPEMPGHCLEENIRQLLSAEKSIRESGDISFDIREIPPYWADIVRLLLINKLFKQKRYMEIENILSQLANPHYSPYVIHRMKI